MGPGTGLFIAGFAIVCVALAMAIWQRPPARDEDGRRVRATMLVNGVLLLGLVALPAGFLSNHTITAGQNVGPIVIGIGLFAAGVIAFVLYSLMWVITRRTNVSAGLAVAISGALFALWSIPIILNPGALR